MAPSVASPSGYKTVYRASGLSPLHMLQLVAFAFCFAGLGLAWHLGQAPQQALTAPATKAGWAIFLASVALSGPFVAMAYGRRLVARVEVSADGGQVRLRDGNLIGARWRTFTRDQLVVGELTPGDAAGEQAAAPPRLQIKIKGGGQFVVPLGRQRAGAEALVQALRG